MTPFAYGLLSLLFSLAVLGVLYSMYRQKRETQFVAWMAIWGALSLHYTFQQVRLSTEAPWAYALDRLGFALAMLALLYAAREYAGHPLRSGLVWILGLVAAAWSFLHAYLGGDLYPHEGVYGGAALLALWSSGVFWRSRRLRTSQGAPLLASVGLILAVAAMLSQTTSKLTLPGLEELRTLGLTTWSVAQLLLAVGLVMLAYEGVQRRVEDNMMSFSRMNLATSGLQTDADLAGMLDRVLGRITDVFQAERALMAVHPGERESATRVVRNFPQEFLEEWERQDLDEFISGKVAGFAGLLLIRDLEDPGALRILDHSPSFEQFKHLLRVHGVRSVLGVSLQSPKRIYGTLLLARAEHHVDSAAELRLLRSLGSLVGMGVENFLLMKHSVRRREELDLLNQTGRALSSTLEVDALLRMVHLELQKLMDARNFYVALIDEAREEIRFELEVDNGVYLPRRARKKSRALPEYVLETAQPLLIADKVADFRQAHGLEVTGRPALSWCGVPILIRGKAVGMMVVQSYEHGGAYDEGHLEVLKMVAAQTSVALENARLFADGQKRLRQISFLHNITRIAISTLNPEEMLAEIAREVQKNFSYDHLGIGLIDYNAKQVEIKAEAGLRTQAVGRRLPLDVGLIGKVVRTGQTVVLEEVRPDERFHGVLANARSAAGIPITYADQMLGLLNVESLSANAFPPDEQTILQALADHLAAALHNALIFQQTQEQAITDGLTGVKTHRYFMEALNGEWKRCTRAGRIFSLLVLDLDRFKQVNDTHGHLEGDLVLARLGRILEQHSRQSNVVARYGGDEFVVLMPETTIEQASVLAERLRLAVATDPIMAKRRLTASFGLASFPLHGHTPEEIVRVADSGMYISKHHGGNRVSVAEQYRQGQAERWRSHVFSSYLESLSRRLDSTGPELLEGLIKRIEEAWETFSGDSQELIFAITEGLATLSDLLKDRVHHDPGYQQRVLRYTLLLAQALHLSEAQVQHIRTATRLQNVGYLALPPEVLSNMRKISGPEFAAFHVHAGAGARLLDAVHLPADVSEIVRHHHEHVNGRGYPDALSGERIPLGARLVAVVDAYCAITSERPYRPARTPEEAVDELERFAGTQFDEMIAKTFVEIIKTEIRESQPAS